MFALTDYYNQIFGFLVDQDNDESNQDWNWVLNHTGNDWEDTEDVKFEKGKGSFSSLEKNSTSSSSKLENVRALENSSLDRPRSQNCPTTPSNADDSDDEWAFNFQATLEQPLEPRESSSSFKGALRKHKETSPSRGVMSIWDGLSGSIIQEKKERRVKFSSTAQCVLIPSRADLLAEGINDLLWFTEAVLEQTKRDAQEEIQKTLTSDSSNLSLYAAMNLLYRPCIKGKHDRKDHFRMLVVDDSTVARRMFIHTIVMGHRSGGTKEHLYVHQADCYKSALEALQTHTYNLICVDEHLTIDLGSSKMIYGSEILRLARQQFENCVLIGISACLDLAHESTELGRETRKRMVASGADIVLRKPIPADTWQQLITCLPMEF